MNLFQRGLVRFVNLIFPLKVYGKENVPQGRTVFVSNHLSVIDSIYMLHLSKKDLYLLAKKELFKNRFFGWILRSFGAISIDRDNPDVKSIIQATRVLKENKKLLIFPEGTRNKTDAELLPIKGGSVIFAVRTKAPIVPVFVDRKAKIFRRTNMIIGKPFELDEFYDKKLTEQDIDALANKIRDKILNAKTELKQITKKKGDKCLS